MEELETKKIQIKDKDANKKLKAEKGISADEVTDASEIN